VFEQGVLALCTNLVSLKLTHVETTAKDLDLRSCTSLQTVELTIIDELEIVRLGPSLQSLRIHCCLELVEVCGSDHLISLLLLDLTNNRKLSKLPCLTGLTRLHTLRCYGSKIDKLPALDGLVGLNLLDLSSCQRVSTVPSDLTGLQCLRELHISCLGGITEIPNLSGLEQLQVIDASHNSQLTSLQGLGDLRALTTLHLSHCESLCRLSDMSKLPNLKVLDLSGTRVELHEEDIHMLEGLQALEPVFATPAYGGLQGLEPVFAEFAYGLDFKRHKIMYPDTKGLFVGYEGWKTWEQWGWKEKDLHYPSVTSCWDGFCGGKGFRIQDVENIWRCIPGPATKFVGSKRHVEEWTPIDRYLLLLLGCKLASEFGKFLKP
jgi:hypothetical protein